MSIHQGRARIVKAHFPEPSFLDKLTQFVPGTKAFSRRQFRYVSSSSFLWLNSSAVTDDEIRRKIGDGTDSDVLTSTIRWIQRAAVEAPLIALDKDDSLVEDGPLAELLANPNPNYGMDYLVTGAIFDLCTVGTAYWMCTTDGFRTPVELEYVPAWAMTPQWDDVQRRDSEFITHYDYNPGGSEPIEVPVEDVIQFRLGVDPRNIRLGLPPLRGLMREIFVDDAAGKYTASTLLQPIPGLLISPADSSVELPQEELEAAKSRLKSGSFGGIIGMTGAVKLDQFGFSPDQIDLSSLRDVSEERVTAALGIPAAVVGFGTGLQATKVGATMSEMRKIAYLNGVMPLLSIIVHSATGSLVPQIEGAEGQRVGFDTSEVDALQEDVNIRANRVVNLVRTGVMTRAEAREEMGLETGPEDDVFLMQLSVFEVPRRGGARPTLEDEAGNGAGEMPEAAADALRRRGAKQRTLIEDIAIERAPRARRVPRANARLARSIDRIRMNTASFERDLEDLFSRIGDEAFEAARDALAVVEGGEAGEASDDLAEIESKQIGDEAMIEQLVLGSVNLIGWQDDLAEVYQTHYGATGRSMVEAMRAAGITFDPTDRYAIEVLRIGGTRSGLVDLASQTRQSIFDALAAGREAGLSGNALAREIGEHVQAGPWRDAATRARTIARTEGAFAANRSVLVAAREMEGVQGMLMHDDRTADGPHDDECPLIDGLVVSIEQAEQLIADEHPNGTRSATPLFEQNIEDLGIDA